MLDTVMIDKQFLTIKYICMLGTVLNYSKQLFSYEIRLC